MDTRLIFRRQVALPTDHGSWVFLLSPLLIGLFAGGRWQTVSLYLVVAVLAAFLARQPITIAIKALVGRRSRADVGPAVFWVALYSLIALVHVAGLVIRGFGYLLYLAIPAVPVFAWYLYLVSRRAERHQLLVEILATGVLALSAPAGMWVGQGRPDVMGWVLWGLTWAQSSASIAHALLRLRQRTLPNQPPLVQRIRRGQPAILITTANLTLAVAFSASGILPPWLFAPYALQWIETARATLRPAIATTPRAIGVRQLIVSALFTLLFVIAWHVDAPAGLP